ncbi:AraC family transcriptional regulator [Kordia periserrulae]|nr:AraC family transcriptional regulator [Kordia periserrulae]
MHLKKLSSLQLYLLPIILLFCSLSLNGQTDSLKGKSYKELLSLYDATFYKNTSQAEIYAIAAYKLAKKEDNKAQMAWAKYNVAHVKYALLLYDESIKDLEEVIHLATELNDNLLLYKSYSLKGNNYFDINRNNESFDNYLNAKKYAKLTKNPLNLSIININISFIKKIHKDYEEAINILLESLDILQKVDNSEKRKAENECTVLMQLADTYLRINQTKKAQQYNDLALNLATKEEFHDAYNWALMSKSIIEYQNKNFAQSIDICREVEKYYKSKNELSNLATPYFYIGKSLYELGKNTQATEYLEKTIAICDEFNLDFQEKKEVYRYLRLSHSALGNFKKANQYANKFYELDRRIDSLDISLNNRLHKEHDIIPLKEEIQSLGENNKYLYSVSAFLLILLIGFYLWYRQKQKRNKKRFQELLVTIEKLERPKEKIISETEVKEATNTITDENVLQILQDLETFEEKKLYLRQDCTLGNVAKKLKTNTTYLSNVINTYKEKSFKSYLSELRINDALIQLKNDSKLRSYTIKAIAEEFGFKRAETFSKAFKAQTNMLPSYYIKSLEKQRVT